MVKENILFGSAYEEERCRECVRVCYLETDLETLVVGDMGFVPLFF
jgi:hypothetical protein